MLPDGEQRTCCSRIRLNFLRAVGKEMEMVLIHLTFVPSFLVGGCSTITSTLLVNVEVCNEIIPSKRGLEDD